MIHPLEELSTAVDPRVLRSPVARDAVRRVAQALEPVLARTHLRPTPYQVVTLAFAALANDRCIVGDEQGVGKTAPAILRIALSQSTPTVIVCTASTMGHWRAEVASWLPGWPIHVLDRGSRPLPPRGFSGVILTTWTLLDASVDALRTLRPRMVIGDEAHYITNEATYRSAAFERLVDDVPRVLLLTGTPVTNRAEELWRLLHLLDPDAWDDPDVLAQVDPDFIDTAQDSAILASVRQYMIRRKKRAALPHLADKQVQVVDVVLSPEARRLYDYADRDFEDWLEREVHARARAEADRTGGMIDRWELERKIDRAIQAEWLTKITYLRALVERLKAPVAIDWIRAMVARGEPTLVFCTYQATLRDIVSALAQAGVTYAVIDGATRKRQRTSIVARFQAREIQALIATDAAQEGVTLHAARHVLLVGRAWTSAKEDQKVDRLHRFGQERQVVAWRLEAKDTVDERMDEVVSSKREIIARVVDGLTPGGDPRGPAPPPGPPEATRT